RVTRRCDGAVDRTPELGGLSAHAEAGVERQRGVTEVCDIVDVRVAGAPVEPGDLGVERTAPGEVGRDALQGHDAIERPTPDHGSGAATADRATRAVEVAPDVEREGAHLVIGFRV